MPATLLGPAARPQLRNFAAPQSTVTPPIVLVQSATSTNSTPFTTNSATFPRKTTAGNILWAAIGCDKQDPIRSVPAGFQSIMSHASASVSIWVGWKIADGTETTITLIHEVGTDAAGDSMWIGEFASADNPDSGVWQILGKATAPTDESTPSAATSGTTSAVPNSGGGLAFFAWDTITTLADLTTYTNGFVQIQGALAAGGRAGLYVALGNGINRNALVETTQTRANSDQCSACVAVFNKVPAPVVVPDWPRQVVHPGVQPSPRARFVPYLLGATDSGIAPPITATGSIDLAGTVTAQAAAAVSGALNLTGTTTAQTPAAAS
ncbi:MAG TPA: hypothetical protein VEO01_40415, partial [Pseudonocardiaceae bacterium]|nr:hypothetical protein [Pseudonocardiaceae bacterium]